MSNIFSLFWEVASGTTYTGVPIELRTRNDLDKHGLALDLERLPQEDGVSYYKRLESVIPLRAGPHQSGLIHGITRELGLEEKVGLKITPIYTSGRWRAPSPRIEVTATNVILYSSWYSETNYEIDTQVNIFDHGDGYLLSDLLEELNNSENFIAELGPLMTGQEKANGLFPSDSNTIIEKEIVPQSKYFSLKHTDIIPGSVTLFDQIGSTLRTVFDTEVSPEIGLNPTSGFSLAFSITTPVIAAGQYYVDYSNGIITSFQPPSSATCRYAYRSFPLRVKWSPVVVYNLRDTDYREKLFEIETMVDTSEREGLVTDEGRQVYQQIFDKSHCLWGR